MIDVRDYLDYYEKKYRGETQVRTLVDALWDVKNQKELIKIHDIYSKEIPPQPSRFRDLIKICFVNSDILDVVTIDNRVFKIYANQLMSPRTLGQFIEYCDLYEYKLFWDKNVYNQYFV